MIRPLALLLAAAALAAPLAAVAQPQRQEKVALPSQLSFAQRDLYRSVFASLRAQDWASVAALLNSSSRGPLHDLARAMLFTAPGSPRVELGPLNELLAQSPHLPQAADLARLASLRGANPVPSFLEPRRTAGLGVQPRRSRARPVRGDLVADEIEPKIQPLLVEDRPAQAEALFNSRSHELSDEARTAFLQRIAWVYFLNGYDQDARRVAEAGARGITEWAIHAEWVAGLAAWRMKDCAAAARSFSIVADRTSDIELRAAGHYWAARADTVCGHPERVQGRLQAAARLEETFYGLLSQSALGIRRQPPAFAQLSQAEWQRISMLPNVQIALALNEIGEANTASDVLRHQARIGDPNQHEALIHLAGRLNLTATQMWLAHNGPRGAHAQSHDRYPAPDWQPRNGWRVDPALVFAHALQESGFRPDAVSSAGARGLLQVRPGTAGDMARSRGEPFSPELLHQPPINIEYGQRYLEYLRDQPSTGGLLPRVIAAYNAGPLPVSQWNARFDQSDPLLFIESIPYWETRGYVPIVLRNYWIYEQKTADASSSRRALAAGLWPRFPGLSGPAAVRIEPRSGITAMGRD